ncbi:formate dehydrogenase subunit gamma [Dankookia sp. P2]|uniref:formate dehydrogenase subunit gamma n=1 Tax=Dankookia sp. P2 TaxID=3423955 RepID=UPI003D67F7A6
MIRHLLAALVAVTLAAGAAQAQSPGRVPVSAEEMELQRTLQGGRIEGRVSIPDARAASLIQPQGKAWRDFHNTTLTWVGGVAILGVLAALAAFLGIRGRIPIAGGASGRTITRFNLLERANHWMVASCFIILGLSGLNLTFGRHLLLPLLGPEAFAAVSAWGKLAHNFLAFPFTLGVVLMLLLWARDNIPDRRDIDWLKLGGGFIGRGHPVAGRFNAGQKGVFWLTVIGGGVVAASGYMLIFPFALTDIAGMQARPHDPWRAGGADGRRHAGPHLYRLHRHGGGDRRHGLRPGRPQLGEGASRALGRRGAAGPPARAAPGRPRRRGGLGCGRPGWKRPGRVPPA